MSQDVAIQVEGLSKAYRIGLAEQRHETMLGAASSVLCTPFRNYRKLRKLANFDDLIPRSRSKAPVGEPAVPKASAGTDGSNPNTHSRCLLSQAQDPRLQEEISDVVWALREVSFEVPRGEVLGIIGRNGAGKSTLLKLLARITEPTRGRACVFGRVGSLLEVGTGFHPDLTGRENIYLNGTLLGMKKREVDDRFDEIVAFSEIEKFIDTPVKRYSNGMRVRLAFSVAAHLEPEIMIVDEVLAVGDAQFQKKCLGKIGEVATSGKTVLFVSHNLASVESLCSRTLVLSRGEIDFVGTSSAAIRHYSLRSPSAFPTQLSKPNSLIDSIRLLDKSIQPRHSFLIGEPIVFEIQLSPRLYPTSASVGIGIIDGAGRRVTTLLTRFQGLTITTRRGGTKVRCTLHGPPLAPGYYTLKVAVGHHYEDLAVVNVQDAFAILNTDFYGSGELPDSTQGCVLAKQTWQVFDP